MQCKRKKSCEEPINVHSGHALPLAQLRVPMAARGLLVLFLFGLLASVEAAPTRTYSQQFFGGQTPTSAMCSGWLSWANGVDPNPNAYSSIEVWSSFNNVVYTCSTQSAVNTLANGLRFSRGAASNHVVLSCNGNTWVIGGSCGPACGGDMVFGVGVSSSCSCSGLWTLRANIWNSNWGGAGGRTCGQPTQTLNVRLVGGGCSDATNSPVISCPSPVSVSTDSGQCCSVETYSVSASDADTCSVLTGPIRTLGRASGSCFSNNEVVAYTVSDSALNTDSCSWSYTVTDNQNPFISCQSPISTNTASNSCSAAVSYSTPSASDNCGISSVQRIAGPPSGGQFGLGTSAVTYRATDTSGRTSTCSISVTVNDATNPTITCPGSSTVSTATNQCGATVSYSAPSVADNCPGATSSLQSGQASGTFFNTGSTSQVFSASDSTGNSQTCSFSITVQDNQAPSISCPGSILASAASGQCSQTISYNNPSVSDNCPGVTFARIGGLASGSSFGVGTTTQTFRATDTSGGRSQCSFNVNIVDDQPPAINCQAPVTVPTNGGQCSGTVNYSFPTASDNCVGVGVTRTSGPGSPSVVGVGSHTAAFRATDGAGLTATCSIPISVVDQQDPTVNCPPPVVTSTPPSASACSTGVAITAATVSDNCPGSSVSGLPSGTYTFPVGTSTRTYTGRDSAGNTASCIASVTVNDGTDPVASCPASITASANSGSCSSIISYSAPTMSDNCFGGSIVRQSGPASGSTFAVGTTTIVYRATDSAGNQDTCSFTVTINDNQNPTISCPASMTVSASNSCDAVVTYANPTASDNCGGVSISRTAGLASGSTFPIGSTTQTFVATDGGGRTASCSFAVVVEDNTNPVITCPANVAVAASSGSCGATVSYSAPTATDNCGSTSIALISGIGNGGVFPLGSTTEVYRATDSAGRTHTCSFTVTVTDQSMPSITCPGSITTTTGPMQCGATVSFSAPTTSDNCGATVAQISGIASGGFFPTGVTTQVFEATDGAGNSQQCSFTVTVNDGEDPVASCPGNIVEPNDPGACGAFVNYVSPTVADNCPGFTITFLSGIGNGNFFPVGVTTEVFEASDPSGNTHQCSFTVTVQDTENPQASCPAPAVISNDVGFCSADLSYVSPTVTDNCPGATISLHTGLGIGGTFPEGVSTEVWRATDSAGNTNDCSFTVEVDDTESPMPSCPGGQSANTDAGQCSAVVVYAAPTVADNCPGASISLLAGLGSGGVFPLGNSLEVYRGIDGTGNTNDCNFSVAVTDAEAPTISCPSSISVASDAGSCTAIVSYASPTFADNCPGSSMSQTGGMGSGSSFPIGVTTEIYEVTDGAGTTASCQFTVTVGDGEAPVASCPAPVTVTSDAGQCSAVVSYSAPTVTDNCAGATISLNSGIGNGGTFPLGVSTEVYEAIDAAGNTHQCSFTVTVTDNENPVPTCPAPVTATTDAGQCGATVNFVAPTATDNCAGQSISLFAGIANGGFFPTGVTTQVYEAVDAAGNSAQCTFTVTVNDGENPVASCPANIAVNTDAGNCDAVVTYSSPTTADNCPGDSIAIFSGLGSGGVFPKGVSTETWEATDAAGNTHQCSFTVTVTDVEIPQASCPSDIIASMDPGQCSATVTYTTPTTVDNCPGDSIALFSGFGSGAAFPEGVSTEVWEATDADGNTHQCSFTVTVRDGEDPVSSCPSSFAVNNDPGVCGATVTYTAPTASDNCVVVSVVQTAGLGSGALFPVGLTTETYEATDSYGNTHTCSFQVTVNEAEPPVVTCPSSFITSTDAGVCSAVVTYSMPTISDNCPGASVVLSSGLGSGATFPIGPNNEVYSVTDGAGNTHQCSFTITVVDNELPVATCPSPLIVGNDPGRCDANVNYTPPTVTDNCPGASIGLTSGTGAGGVFGLGSSIDEHTAVDAEGNVHTCFVPVTVEDRESPVPTCYGDVTSGNDAGACGAVVSYTVPTVTDNCPPASIFLQSGIGDGLFFPTGTTVETYHASDSAGNTAQCNFNVVVNDVELPVVNCPGNINAPNDPSRCDAVVTYATPSASDNCVVSSVNHIGGLGSGVSFPVGFTTETWQAVDQDGNVGQCSFTVEVQDLQLPTISCPPSVNVPNDAGQCGALVSYVAPVASDNCVAVSVVQTLGLGSSSVFPIGQTTEEYTVTDNSGNVATCSFTVTVAEAEDPVANCPGNVSVNNDVGQCAAVVTYPAPTASDNCPGVTIAQTSGLGSGSTFPVGSTTEIYTATDNAGRTHSCQFIVEVLETELPVPSCPASMAVPNFVGQCGAVVTYSAPTATDNCPGVVLGQIAGSGSGSFFAVGTATETYEATDAAGNTATCSFGVTVNDVEAPTAVCPTGVAQATDAGVCTAVVAYAASVADNCNGATLTHTAGLGSGAAFPLGDTTESYLATDLSGNSNSCSFAVTVTDQEAPVITAPGDYTVFVDEPYNFVVTALDNCGTVTLVQDFGPLPGDSSSSSTTESVQFTATDPAGNAETVQFTITVLPAAGGLGLNIYMYEEFELAVATAAFGSDTWLTFELRPVGNGPAMYRSEQEPIHSVMRFQGPHDMTPGQAGFWVVSTSRTEYLTDINICGSRYVNFPDGCAVALP